MILLYELVQSGASHAPFTRAFTQTMAAAFPGQPISIHAHPTHLREAFAESDARLDACLTQEPIPQTITSPTAIAPVLRVLSRTYRPVRASEPLVVVLTGQPQHIWAAKLFQRAMPGFRCHLVLHGDIHHLRPPYRRNPVAYLTDWFASIAYANRPGIRFLVLEPHIKASVARHVPKIGPYMDAIHHPCSPAPAAWGEDAGVPPGPLRFAIVGIAGKAKGLDVFARLALRTRAATGDAAEFRLVGKVQRGWRDLDLGGISGPLPFTEEWLPRAAFEDELRRLHYIVLPYSMDYYAYAASGVLLDALRWRKPVIAFRVPPVQELADRFGDVGYLCASEDEMAATVERLATHFDPARYAAQRDNLDRAYRSRLPEAVAAECRDVLHTGGA
jgi:glycosyltransferase involved in cell wall biosynthesis